MSNSYLGRGWSFPPVFDRSSGTVEMTADEEDIRRSLQIILRTLPGERVMRPDFGAGMDRLLFEPLTTTLKTYMRKLVRDAVLRFEPRVDLESVELDDSGELEGRVLISLEYTGRATNSRANLVFPFYKTEGTNV
jgi:phage baseplate assembly protein W